MLRWPARAARAIRVLLKPLQDVTVYVEDKGEGSRAFYSELLTRLTHGRFRIRTVVPLGGRDEVEKQSLAFASNGIRDVLFIADGDLDWVAGKPQPAVPGLYRLQAYCIENFLICENAAVECIAAANGTMLRDDIRKRLGWSAWLDELRQDMPNAFGLFAIAHVHKTGLSTTGRGFGAVCSTLPKKAAKYDAQKSRSLIASFRVELEKAIGKEACRKEWERVRRRIAGLPDALMAVSGKDFLLPLLKFRLLHVGKGNYETDSLRFRLAQSCNLVRLRGLSQALRLAARGHS